MSSGGQARTSGNHKAAAAIFRRALELKPDNFETLYLLGTSLAFTQQYDKARQILTKAIEVSPRNLDAWLARTRAAAWAGDFTAAEKDMAETLSLGPDNAEANLLRGWLHYVQDRHSAAISAYQLALKLAPGFTDAQKGLDRARQAEKLAQATPVVQKPKPRKKNRWRLDAGLLQSSFTRLRRKAWQEPSFGLGYAVSDQLAVSGRIDYSHRFGLTDVRYEGGAAWRIEGGHNTYVSAGVVPNDDFLDKYRVLLGGRYNTGLDKTVPGMPGPLHLTLDGKRAYFRTTISDTLTPGFVQVFGDFSATGKWINSKDSSDRRTFGWLLRADWRVKDGTTVYLGRADAPETEEEATVGQRSIFAGIATNITPDFGLRFDYAREDRENSYIRRVLGVGMTLRF